MQAKRKVDFLRKNIFSNPPPECPLSGAVIIPNEKTTGSRSQRIRKLDSVETLTADRSEDVGGVGLLQGHRNLTPLPGD